MTIYFLTIAEKSQTTTSSGGLLYA